MSESALALYSRVCNHGSRHVADKSTERRPIWYRQPLSENVCTVELGAALARLYYFFNGFFPYSQKFFLNILFPVSSIKLFSQIDFDSKHQLLVNVYSFHMAGTSEPKPLKCFGHELDQAQ